jgi:hypothetical protein
MSSACERSESAGTRAPDIASLHAAGTLAVRRSGTGLVRHAIQQDTTWPAKLGMFSCNCLCTRGSNADSRRMNDVLFAVRAALTDAQLNTLFAAALAIRRRGLARMLDRSRSSVPGAPEAVRSISNHCAPTVRTYFIPNDH